VTERQVGTLFTFATVWVEKVKSVDVSALPTPFIAAVNVAG
jgi:hypothetical protein